jgi:hypothetical protein
MIIRLIMFAAMASFLAAPMAVTDCAGKVSKSMACACCAHEVAGNCGNAGKAPCNPAPPSVDRTIHQTDRSVIAAVLFSLGELQPVALTSHFVSESRGLEPIPSPPPLSLNCIRLI